MDGLRVEQEDFLNSFKAERCVLMLKVCADVGGEYSFRCIFEDLSGLLPAAALLHTLPLHVALLYFLEKAVGSFPPGQHLAGRLAIQEDWRETRRGKE